MTTAPGFGVFEGFSHPDYLAVDAMSAGGLKRMVQSPAHFYGKQLDPERPRDGDSVALSAGRLAHVALLEPHALAERYEVAPDDHNMRTKIGQQRAADAAAAGVELITAAQLLTAKRQARSALRDPAVAALFQTPGPTEVSAFWTDPVTGQVCKCRPDKVARFPSGGVVVLDLKTCQDASPDGFARAMWKWRYDLQDAWYSDGWTAASGEPVLAFIFVCVEADYPHASASYCLTDRDRDDARRDYRRLLNSYAECKAANTWPGYPSGIQEIALPAWARRR